MYQKNSRKKKSNIKKRISGWFKEFFNDLKNKSIALFFLFLAGFFLWLLIEMLYYFYGFSVIEWLKTVPFLYDIFLHFFENIKTQSDLGIFYTFLISSLFFLPIPLEALYFRYLYVISPIEKVFFIALSAIIAGQVINYLIGRFFGFILIHFIKKKTKTKIKLWLKKYGIMTIFTVHLVPFPFQIVNVISGILRQKIFRWFLAMFAGLIIKHLIMNLIFINL